MRRLQRILFNLKWLLTCLCIHCFNYASANEPTELLWCVDDIPLRHSFENGVIVGPTVDFMHQLASKSGFSLVVSADTPFKRCLQDMKTGDAALMMALNESPARREYMHLFPVYDARSESLFTALPAVASMQSVAEVKDFRLAIVEDYLYNTSDILSLQNDNTVVSISDVQAGLAMLILGHVDLVLSPHYSTLARIAANPRFNGNIHYVPINLKRKGDKRVHLGVSKYAQVSPELLDAIKLAIQSLRQSGEAEQILFPPSLTSSRLTTKY